MATPPKPTYVKDLVLLFSVPAAIALVAALAVYIPRSMAKPAYDFVYAYCVEYNCRDSYSVDGAGHVARQVSGDASYKPYSRNMILRYYDAAKDSSRSLSIDQAEQLHLDTSSKSPDGYTLRRGESGSGSLFWGRRSEDWSLKNGALNRPVVLTEGGSYGSDDINFLGWVSK